MCLPLSNDALLSQNQLQKKQIEKLLYENNLDEAEIKLKREQLKMNQVQALEMLGSFEFELATGRSIWSDEMLRIYGLTVEEREQTFESWLSYVHPDDICSLVSTIEIATETTKSSSFSHRIIRRDGEVRHINTETQYQYNEHGEPTSLIGILHDVTAFMVTIAALKESEAALRDSELHFKTIVERAQEGIWLTSEKHLTTFVNSNICEMLGYTSEEMHGKDLYYFVADTDKNVAAKSIGLALQGKMETVNIRLIAKSKTIVWTRMVSTPMMDENDNYKGTIAAFSDITEHKELTETLQFKAQLLNTIGQAVIGTKLDGVVNYWNMAAEKIYGWTAEEALGQNILDLTPSLEAQEKALEIMTQLNNGESWSGEFNVRRKNGTTFPAFVTNAPVAKNKKLIGIIGISTDISEKKQLEELLDRANKLAAYGTYDMDVMSNKLYWSDITKEIHEVDKDFVPDIITAIGFFRIGHSRKAMTKALMNAMQKGTPWDIELEIITGRGNERWVRSIGEAQFAFGKCVRIAGTFQDIHDHKMAEHRYRDLAEEKNEILETIGDAFFSVDKEWHITYFNRKAENALAITREEALGKKLWSVFPEAAGTIFEKEYRLAIKQKSDRTFKAFYEPLDSWFDVTAYPSKRGLSIYFTHKAS